MERAAVDETASVLGFLRDANCCTSAGGVGVESGISPGNFGLRKRGMAMVDASVAGSLLKIGHTARGG
jgi:hypothetical protein